MRIYLFILFCRGGVGEAASPARAEERHHGHRRKHSALRGLPVFASLRRAGPEGIWLPDHDRGCPLGPGPRGIGRQRRNPVPGEVGHRVRWLFFVDEGPAQLGGPEKLRLMISSSAAR